MKARREDKENNAARENPNPARLNIIPEGERERDSECEKEGERL